MSKLKDCPFCKSSLVNAAYERGRWRVRCRYCGAHGGPTDTRENAVAAWNTRTLYLEKFVEEGKFVRCPERPEKELKVYVERVNSFCYRIYADDKMEKYMSGFGQLLKDSSGMFTLYIDKRYNPKSVTDYIERLAETIGD